MGKEISGEEGAMPLIPSSTIVAGRFGQLSMNLQTQSVCVRDDVGSRCSFIITGGCGCFELVVDSRRSATTASRML